MRRTRRSTRTASACDCGDASTTFRNCESTRFAGVSDDLQRPEVCLAAMIKSEIRYSKLCSSVLKRVSSISVSAAGFCFLCLGCCVVQKL